MTKPNFGGDPDQYGEALYNKFKSKFPDSSDSDIKEMCLTALEVYMWECDTTMRLYYGLCRSYIRDKK